MGHPWQKMWLHLSILAWLLLMEEEVSGTVKCTLRELWAPHPLQLPWRLRRQLLPQLWWQRRTQAPPAPPPSPCHLLIPSRCLRSVKRERYAYFIVESFSSDRSQPLRLLTLTCVPESQIFACVRKSISCFDFRWDCLFLLSLWTLLFSRHSSLSNISFSEFPLMWKNKFWHAIISFNSFVYTGGPRFNLSNVIAGDVTRKRWIRWLSLQTSSTSSWITMARISEVDWVLERQENCLQNNPPLQAS